MLARVLSVSLLVCHSGGTFLFLCDSTTDWGGASHYFVSWNLLAKSLPVVCT